MSVVIGNSTGRVIINDTSQRVRVGYNTGVVFGPGQYEEYRRKEDELIEKSHDPETKVEPLNPRLADFEQVRKWVDICEQRHSTGASYTAESPSQVMIRLIDVETDCVIETTEWPRYLALSYTWGKTNQVKLTTAAKEALSVPGRLATLGLPNTIQDAMTLTSKLGERYLWVDVLCILQDDDTDKQVQLARMCDIYTNAIVTIVAATGSDADAGLPRVNDDYNPQPTEGRIDSPWSRMNKSAWASRAWTYQETVLSQRLLFVLSDKMMLACEHLVFSEGETKPEGPIMDARFENFSSKILRMTALQVYEHAVNIYSTMQLGIEQDMLNAFDDILVRLQPYLRCDFIHGLPTLELESALTWRTGTVNSNWTSGALSDTDHLPEPPNLLRRRLESDGNTPYGPSWSWTGWVGEIHYNYHVWPILEMACIWITLPHPDPSSEPPDPNSRHLLSSIELRGDPINDQRVWSWNYSSHNPGYFTDSTQEGIRFSNTTEPQSEQPHKVSFLIPGAPLLCFVTSCVCVDLVPVSELRNDFGQRACDAARRPASMSYLPIVDEEHFYAGAIDVCQLPSSAAEIGYPETQTPSSSGEELSFVLQLTKEVRVQTGLQLVLLSRFVGFANTVEEPHRYRAPKLHPQIQELHRLDNVRAPFPPPFSTTLPQQAQSLNDGEGPGENSVKEDTDPPFETYDKRRFESEKFYPFFCVLLVEWRDGIARRLGCGQLHIDAISEFQDFKQVVNLA